jgi:hypothetical protein
MPDIYYQDGANQRHITGIYYQDGANLRTLQEVYYQDGANLRLVWTNAPATVYLEDAAQSGRAIAPSTASATINFTSGGLVQSRANSNPYALLFTWLLSGAASAYQIRATVSSGTSPAGSALNTWLNMGVDNLWVLSRSTSGTSTSVLTIEIRDVATSTIRASATFTLQATQNDSP